VRAFKGFDVAVRIRLPFGPLRLFVSGKIILAEFIVFRKRQTYAEDDPGPSNPNDYSLGISSTSNTTGPGMSSPLLNP
jgi:hypothetical protein